MPTIHRFFSQHDPTTIPAQSIGFAKVNLLVQSAVATLPPGTRYVTFATAYGTPPVVVVVVAGTTARMGAGTARFSFDAIRVRPGSFRWVGTPNVRARWTATGYRA